MLLATVSCTKEGVFNPKEKIAKIYKETINVRTETYDGHSSTTSDTTAKHLTEEWTWDGKLLTTVTSYYQVSGTPTAYNVLTLTYDGKQLSKVSDASGQDYSVYTYDGSKLTKVESFEGNELRSIAEVTHDGKHISKVVMTYKGEGEPGDVTKFAMRTLVPTQKVLDKMIAVKAKEVADETVILEFTYDGGNATKIVMTYGSNSNYSQTTEYTFDKKKNPFSGNFATIGEGGLNAFNENNILTEKETSTYTENGRTQTQEETTEYTYEYDGKFPTSVSYTNTYSQGDYYTTKTTHTTYYEYAE